jgi:hypothetical protein
VEIEKNDGQVMPKNMQATSLQHLYKFVLREHYKTKLDLHTLEFCCLAMQTSSVREACEHPE